MAVVFIPPQLRELTGGRQQVEVEGETLRQITTALEAQFSGLAARLTEQGEIAADLAVVIDGETTSQGMYARVKPDSEIHILPALGGG